MFVSIRKYTDCKEVHEVNRRVLANLIPTLLATCATIQNNIKLGLGE
jgi:hypothetical protein